VKSPDSAHMLRRDFCVATGGAVAAFMLSSACRRVTSTSAINDGRLSARTLTNIKTTVTGKVVLKSGADRDAILQIPAKAGDSAVPLLVFLHGAGQSAAQMLEYMGSVPEETGVAVLAANSVDYTWDAINDTFGPDVLTLDSLLEEVFKKVLVDPSRLALGGFSDGATYGLSLGLINGDLFTRIVAFSPGFVLEGVANGKPELFISHGTHDKILPIDSCSRRIVGSLKSRGYQVTLREFDGGHEVPDGVAHEALAWVAR
jgi:phospholipase/carboxylesterase